MHGKRVHRCPKQRQTKSIWIIKSNNCQTSNYYSHWIK
jgi:hypothetical protein